MCICMYVLYIYMFLVFFLSHHSPVPVADKSHVSPEGQLGFFVLFPALLCFLHPDVGKCKAAAGAEPPGVFQ